MADDLDLDAPIGTDEPQPGQEAKAAGGGKSRIGLAALAIMVIHFLAKIGGYIQKKALAHFTGTGIAADACTGMEKIFQLIFFIPEELLSHSLLPVFARVKADEGEPEAWRLASLTGTIHALILILVTILGIVFAPFMVNLVLVGFAEDQAKFDLTVKLVRVALLGLFCTSLGSLTYVLLNAYKRFVTPALGDVTQKLGIVIGMCVCFYGFKDLGPLGYAIGFILGGVFKLVTHLLALGPQLKLVRPGFDFSSKPLRELGVLMVPLIAGTFVSKFRDGWEQRLVSQVAERVTGSLAALDYAKKVALMPVLVVPYAFGKAVFPFFTDWVSHKEIDRLTDAFHYACRLMVFVFLPMTAAFFVLRGELVALLYRGGQFTQQSVDLTAGPFMAYSAALIIYSLEMIAIQVFYAYRDMTTPFYLGLIGSSLQILIAWWVGLVLDLGATGIAMGYALSKTTKLALMWWTLRHRLSSFQWPQMLRMALKTALATIVMTVFLVYAQDAAPRFLDLSRTKHVALFLAGCGVGGTLLFVGVAALLRIEELVQVKAMVLGKLRRRKK